MAEKTNTTRYGRRISGTDYEAGKPPRPRENLQANRKLFENKLNVKEMLADLQDKGVITKTKKDTIFSGRRKAATLLDAVLQADDIKFKKFLDVLRDYQIELYELLFQKTSSAPQNIGVNDAVCEIELGVAGTILLEELTYIVTKLKNVRELTEIMKREHMLNDYQEAVVNSGNISQLVKIVAAGGKDAFEQFAKALLKSKNHEVVQRLDERMAAASGRAQEPERTRELASRSNDTGEPLPTDTLLSSYKKILEEEKENILIRMNRPDHLARRLMQRHVLSADEYEAIRSSLSDETRAIYLLNFLGDKDMKAFEIFLDILKTEYGPLFGYFLSKVGNMLIEKHKDEPDVNQPLKPREPDGNEKKIGVLSPSREPRSVEQIRSEGSHLDKTPEYPCKATRNCTSENTSNSKQVRSGNGKGQLRTPLPLDAKDLDTPFHIGSMVEINVAHQNVYGMIRWIGYYDSPGKPIAGIEMEEMNPAGTDGTYMNVSLFHCQPKRAMFMFLKSCRPDSRFQRETESYAIEQMHFHVTCGNQKLLFDAEASVFNVRSAIRKAFVIPDRDGLTVQYWHQEDGFEDWVELRDESFRYLSGTVRNRLNVIVERGDPDPEGENMNRQLARALEDAYNLYLVSDESLFDTDHC